MRGHHLGTFVGTASCGFVKPGSRSLSEGACLRAQPAQGWWQAGWQGDAQAWARGQPLTISACGLLAGFQLTQATRVLGSRLCWALPLPRGAQWAEARAWVS